MRMKFASCSREYRASPTCRSGSAPPGRPVTGKPIRMVLIRGERPSADSMLAAMAMWTISSIATLRITL